MKESNLVTRVLGTIGAFTVFVICFAMVLNEPKRKDLYKKDYYVPYDPTKLDYY